ncbi:helix-turn-helix domain-containing protein [Nocardioides sp. ChNu-153]|uniref:AraC family transcriptional regulator n=1 Tax=unclassified Nocardioides TaxID=2615069 RepID=UPI0024055CB4|nr:MULTISPECIES: AraC family transcriptional regulator [unclassified Nocardioides]MDF9715534.1 AraC family transcriptional regulator [Nocardioides sp. ChNu-99]MDN7120711.1 helix-turn-helix domain-containing protein [Nocardioides sp. ChNu-153]
MVGLPVDAASPASFPDPVPRDWHFPRSVAGVAVLLDWARSRGLDAAELLRGTGLAVADVHVGPAGEREVTADQELTVVRALLRHLRAGAPGGAGGTAGTGEDARLGAEVGGAYHLSSFGIFGFALLASPTLADAVTMATRYLDLSFTFALPRAELVPAAGTADAAVRVVVDGTTLPADVRAFLVARDAVAIATALVELLPDMPVRAEHSAERAEITFAARHLGRSLPQGNPQTVAVCEGLCADLVSRRRARTGVAQEVRVLVAQELSHGAPAAAVAARLGLSERTLRRRLAGEGTSYSELLDEVRSTLAVELLATTLSLDDVALRLGYAEASSFIHAHRRWTGRTPRQRG